MQEEENTLRTLSNYILDNARLRSDRIGYEDGSKRSKFQGGLLEEEGAT